MSFGLYKVDMGPKAPGARTHFHRSISESFYVLSGEVELYNGERWVTGRQGDFLYVPVGGLHAFKNDGDDPVSMLMLFSPGAPRESTSSASPSSRSAAARSCGSSRCGTTASSSDASGCTPTRRTGVTPVPFRELPGWGGRRASARLVA